jgi:hypothetical protein
MMIAQHGEVEMKIPMIVDGDRQSLIDYLLGQAQATTNLAERAEFVAMADMAQKDEAYCRAMFEALKRTAKKHGKKIVYPTTPS